MRHISYLLILTLAFVSVSAGAVSPKSKRSKRRSTRVRRTQKFLFKSSIMPKRLSLKSKFSYGSTGLQSAKAPYRVGVLNNDAFNVEADVEYQYSKTISFAFGPSFSSGTKSEKEGFFQKDVTGIKYQEYKLNSYALLNYRLKKTRFRPYVKFSIGKASFDLEFSSEAEGFSDLNDSIVGINGKGNVIEYGLGGEFYFYKSFGMFAELTYKSFNVKEVEYQIEGDLADYEKGLIAEGEGANFTGLAVKYGVSFRF